RRTCLGTETIGALEQRDRRRHAQAGTAVVSRGCGTIRMYGFGDSHSPKISLASSLETEPAMITSSPCRQFTGVATLCFAVSCSESITRSTSWKLRPVVIGEAGSSLTFLSGPPTQTLRPF